MGWFRRRREGAPDNAGRRDPPPSRSLRPLLVFGEDERLAVGAAYQPAGALRGHRVGQRCQVELVPQPGNPVDRNAVAMLCGGRQVGFLSAAEAARRQGGIIRANALGYRVVADAVVEIVDGVPTVRMTLPRPEDLLGWLELPAAQRAGGFRAPARLRVRGLAHFQPALTAALGSAPRSQRPAVLQPKPIVSGKHAGECDGRVFLDGVKVGAVRAADLAAAPRVAEALRAGPVGCEVVLVRYPNEVWASITVP